MPRGSYVEADGHDVICEIDSCGVSLPQHAANARLIAAAPELLAAMKLAAWFSPYICEDAAAQIRAAIAKATGETP